MKLFLLLINILIKNFYYGLICYVNIFEVTKIINTLILRRIFFLNTYHLFKKDGVINNYISDFLLVEMYIKVLATASEK